MNWVEPGLRNAVLEGEDLALICYLDFIGLLLCRQERGDWSGLIDWMKTTVLEKENNIHAIDLELLKIVDTAEDAANHIVDFYSKYLLKPNF